MNGRKHLKQYFSQGVEENTASLYKLARRLTGNSTDAEDLVADTVTRAWVAITSLEDKSRFRPWIFRILNNCFISNYRKQSIRPSETSYEENTAGEGGQEITALLVQQSDDFLFWWGNPEREFFNDLLGEDIMAAIHSLPEVFRMTVLLINLEGFSYDEAAEILGVPPGTIRSRMKRGRTLLQKALWEQAREAGIVTGDNVTEGQK